MMQQSTVPEVFEVASDSRKENFVRIVLAAILAAVAGLGLTPRLLAQEGEYERAGRSLSDLMKVDDGPGRFVPGIPRSTVDEAKASKEGIRKIAGRRLILFTDLPYDPLIEELPEVFDQAFPIWCNYFSVDPASRATWQMTGFLMKDGDRFRRTGLLPRHLPPFRNGFSVNYDLWLYEQETPYYRRHLLLHEGTHGFMNTILRSCGPPWYMEGTAELLGTHQWKDGRLTMGIVPKSRDDVPGWGRVRRVQDLFAEGKALSLPQVFDFSGTAHQDNDAYAWSWAAAALLDLHPRYQVRFRSLSRAVEDRDFTERFRKLIGDDWRALAEEWQVFVGNIEYGYDVPRMAIDFTPGGPPRSGWNLIRVEADRGWQNSRIRLDGGKAYEIRAQGRYQVADQPAIWWCEPGGVTIRYYHGRPLGVLLAAVRSDDPHNETSVFLQPETVGLGTTIRTESAGTLYLRINDSAAELDDNAGTLDVAIREATENP
ncbi:MAG: hypothetical protein GXX96_14990 [Planctomycetaceae bacterium]|nr:hypothetical protein [Planctomycetaceae bacterium]